MSIYYITGISGSGKSTAAEKLSALLGDVPIVALDYLYKKIGRAVRFTRYDKLFDPKFAASFMDFDKIRADVFKEHFESRKYCQDIIVEGYALGFGEDQKLIESLMPGHKIVGFNMTIPFLEWVERTSVRLSKDKKWRDEEAVKEYYGLVQSMRSDLGYYEITNESQLLMEHTAYQRTGLTDVKWDQLQMPDWMDGESILDLGCNSGWIGKYCIDRGAAYVEGVDHNWRYLEDCKDIGYDSVVLADFNGDWQKDLLPEYDRVFCLAMMQYVQNIPWFIRKLADLTAGECVIEMPLSGLDPVCIEYFHREVSPGRWDDIRVPSRKLMLAWLRTEFEEVDVVGQSVSPDNSFRLIFKCRKGKKR
jgi:SAM-dependent methyltransferase